MRKTGFALLAGLLVLSIAAVGFAAEPAGKSPAKKAEPPSWKTSSLVEKTATVEAVDQSTRMVTLKGPEGNSVTFKASAEVRNLAQVKVGDLVKLAYYESLAVRVLKKDEAFPAAGESAAMARAKPGEKPAGVVGAETSCQRHDHGDRQEGEDRDPEGGGRKVRHGDPEEPEEPRQGEGGGPPGDHVHGGGRGEGREGGKEEVGPASAGSRPDPRTSESHIAEARTTGPRLCPFRHPFPTGRNADPLAARDMD